MDATSYQEEQAMEVDAALTEQFGAPTRTYRRQLAGVDRAAYRSPAAIEQDARAGLTGDAWVRATIGYAINYCPELPSYVAAWPANALIAESDLVEVCGRGTASGFSLGEAVRQYRRQTAPDLSEPLLTRRTENFMRIAQLETLDVVSNVILFHLGGLAGKNADRAQRLMAQHREALCRDDFLGSLMATRDLAETLRHYLSAAGKNGSATFGISRTGLLHLLALHAGTVSRQLENLTSDIMAVYENLGYALPESLAFCAEIAREREAKAERPRRATTAPPAITSPQPRLPKPEVVIDTARLEKYVQDFETYRTGWARSNKQRRNFRDFERVLVRDYHNLAGTARMAAVDGDFAGVVVGVLMQLQGLSRKQEVPEIREEITRAIKQQAHLRTERSSLDAEAVQRAHGGSTPSITDVAAAFRHVVEHWPAFESALKESWPGGLDERNAFANKLAAVLFDAAEHPSQRRVAAPLAGIVDVQL